MSSVKFKVGDVVEIVEGVDKRWYKTGAKGVVKKVLNDGVCNVLFYSGDFMNGFEGFSTWAVERKEMKLVIDDAKASIKIPSPTTDGKKPFKLGATYIVDPAFYDDFEFDVGYFDRVYDETKCCYVNNCKNHSLLTELMVVVMFMRTDSLRQ